MTQQFENFVNAALDKSLASDVTLPTANKIPVFTGIGRQVTGKTIVELGLATSSQLTGKADLVDGLVPANQLPSYVDDVLEYANLASFPLLGEASKLYIAIDTNLVYRWSGSTYAVTSSSLALGETSTTAYRGDRGKTAYDHSQATGNPHNLPAASTNVDGYLTSTDWNTFNNKQAALADVITANTYGSATQYPKVTVNAKGIVTGVTLQTVEAPATFSDSVLRVSDDADSTKKIAFQASVIGTGQTRTIIMPDVDVNLASYARAYQSTGLKTITKQLYTVFPTGSTAQRYLTTDGSTPNFTPPASPFLFILLPSDPDFSRPVLVNVKGIGYSTNYPASGTWVFERRIIVGRGTDSGVDAYGGVPLLETVSNFAFGPFNGAVFGAFQKNNADIVGSQRVLCLTAEIPNNTAGSNLVVRVIAEIIYSEDTLSDTWL